MSNLKLQLHQLCLASIEQRIQTIRQSMHDSHASGLEETKSSSGDKYETGRAMMHLEIEKLSTQLAEAEKQKAVLLQINPSVVSDRVQNGSLVITSLGNYYLSVSAGIFTIDRKEYITLSSSSPLGAKLIGLQAGHQIEWNKKIIRIEQTT